ncbi:MAG: response regulator, partial [candidate division Zixibacteria bacterium]|nr:response regulator [candidate division Zixibacteria bacterium]
MNNNTKILVADDDDLMRDFVEETLIRAGFNATCVSNGSEAVDELMRNNYGVIFTDIKMPGADGFKVLETALKINPESKVIMITAYGKIEDAVRAMKIGAFDYLTKSQDTSPDEIEMLLRKALDFQTLQTENKRLKSELTDKFSFASMIGKSPRMQQVYDLISTVADSNATVLITGKSGTGKELVARAIHFNGCRKDGPFVKLNCAALPDGLVESELFGHEKGAFTGAIKTVKGRFELSNGGTILLDEISEMSTALQAKLLRVIQEQEFERIGSGQTIRTDVRIIATSNRNLRNDVRQGNFREDLYYRLNVIPIDLPELTERQEDIPLLIEHFVGKFSKENSKEISSITDEAMRGLMEYHWPGNVRELENCIERAVVVNK